MLSSTTYIKTPATGLVISLADAKLHLRVDDVEQGTESEVVIGSGDAQLNLVTKLAGERGNNYSIEVLETGANSSLSVQFDSDQITIILATDTLAFPVSTANDVIAALVNVPAISQRFSISSGGGNGTGVMDEEPETFFSGGADGTSEEDTLITNLIRVAQGQAETILRRSLLDQTLVHLTDVFPGNNRLFLERGPIRSVVVSFVDGDGNTQTLDAANYVERFESPPEYIELKSGVVWPTTRKDMSRAVSVEMQCGYATEADIPAEIQQSIRLMIGYWYSVRENVLIASGAQIVPQGAEWLLWPYRDLRF